MAAAAALEIACAGSLAVGLGGLFVALRTRAGGRADRLALRLAREREAGFVDAARRLADAARSCVDDVRAEIALAVRRLVPAIDAVLLFEAHEGELRCVFAAGERTAYFAGTALALDDATALPVLAYRAGHRVQLNGKTPPRPVHPSDAGAVAVPLALDGGRSCVLVASSRRPLDADAVDRVAALADHASPAYVIALDRAIDRHRAEYDALTGLLGPRALRQRLGALIEAARHAPLAQSALLFVDTDGFKAWNDRYGHAAGDALLRELARVLRGAARSDADLVARNGGDEFCLVFGESGKADAIERAEALRARIASLDLAHLRPAQAPEPVTITASIGVACFPADAATASALLENADAAMYHSKRGGRDAVSYYGVDGRLTRL
ncbi:MAG TPA: GGDEF domain-containing protein [Candidatus Sulfotelmatobacter sp.]|nr:GGDEF domain-containing protein [Candidatus Sulfotelmatobacter sp.]